MSELKDTLIFVKMCKSDETVLGLSVKGCKKMIAMGNDKAESA